MSRKTKIRGQGGEVEIDVFGFENPSAQLHSDANWLNCEVVVRVDAFFGRLKGSFTVYDFVQFHSDLEGLLERRTNSAAFSTDEEYLCLNIEMKSTGVAEV